MQALYLLALDPVAEALADRGSYGFRRGRSCADAIERCFTNLYRRSPSWVLEGDIQGCFDNISHLWLLEHVPMDRSILRKWLKSGYLENQMLYDTISGTPQGGIISPVLANLALDGLEKRLLAAFPLLGPGSTQGRAAQVHLIRYADDFVITANSREILVDRVKPLIEAFLAERGLVLSPEKTLITHVSEGFDFLGQNVRRYPNGKLLIKPARKSVRSFLAKVQAVVKQLWSAPPARYTDCEAQSDYPGMGKLSSACRIQAGFLTHGSHDLPHNLAVGKSPPSEEKHAVDQAKILHAIWAPRLVVLCVERCARAGPHTLSPLPCQFDPHRPAHSGALWPESVRPQVVQLHGKKNRTLSRTDRAHAHGC